MVILPILTPLVTATLCLFLWTKPRWQRLVSITGAAALLGVSLFLLTHVNRHGIAVAQLGNWPAPFGISIVADLFGSIMVAVTGVIGFAVGCRYSNQEDVDYLKDHLDETFGGRLCTQATVQVKAVSDYWIWIGPAVTAFWAWYQWQ